MPTGTTGRRSNVDQPYSQTYMSRGNPVRPAASSDEETMPSARKWERAPRGSIALALPRDDREAALAVDAGALGAFASGRTRAGLILLARRPHSRAPMRPARREARKGAPRLLRVSVLRAYVAAVDAVPPTY